jgi:hypothetical protein
LTHTGATGGFSVNRTAKSMAGGERGANRSLLLVVVEETTGLPFEEAGPIWGGARKHSFTVCNRVLTSLKSLNFN